MTTEYFPALADKGFGIGPTFDYDRFKQWLEGQQWQFSKGFTIQGDIISANWDGDLPLDLSSLDSTATAGFALDTSEGAAQYMGDVFVGGDVTLLGSGQFATAASGDRIQIDASSAVIQLIDGTSGVVGQIGWAASGFGTDDLTIENQSGLGDIDILASGSINLDAEGSAGFGVRVVEAAPAGAAPARPFSVTAGTGAGFRVHDSNNAATPTWAFDNDTDTGITRPSSNVMGFNTNGIEVFRCTSASEIAYQNHGTTSSAANTHIRSDNGIMRRSTSSLKYKPDWEPALDAAHYTLPTPIRWTDEKGQTRLGFGAEHIHEAVPEAYEDEIYDLRSLVAILSEKVKHLEQLCLI